MALHKEPRAVYSFAIVFTFSILLVLHPKLATLFVITALIAYSLVLRSFITLELYIAKLIIKGTIAFILVMSFFLGMSFFEELMTNFMPGFFLPRPTRWLCIIEALAVEEMRAMSEFHFWRYFAVVFPCKVSFRKASPDPAHAKIWFPLYFFIGSVVSNYYQLVADHKNVAVILTCFFTLGTIVDTFRSSVDVIILKVICYKLLSVFGAKGRLKIYQWMKKHDFYLAFTDDFNPVLHPRGDKDLMLIKPCTFGYIRARKPSWLDWASLKIRRGPHPLRSNSIRNVTIDTEAAVGSGWGQVIETFEKFDGHDATDQGYARFFTLEFPGGQTVHAESKYQDPSIDRLSSELPDRLVYQPDHELTTQLRIDEEDCQEYVWTETKYHLFMYIMITWKKTGNGAVKRFKTLYSNRRFIEVRGTHELADCIQRMDTAALHVLSEDNNKFNDMMA